MSKLFTFLTVSIALNASALSLCTSNKGVTYVPNLTSIVGNNGVTIKQVVGGVWTANDSQNTMYNQIGNNFFGVNNEVIFCF